MNYQKLYIAIITNRQKNPIPKEQYGENHHIKPKCLGGGDEETNLVRLTAREHFLCHYCLTEIFQEGTPQYYKMLRAFMIMKRGHVGDRYINSRLYASKREEFSKMQSRTQSGENNSNYGTVWINKEQTSKKIKKEELQSYLNKGWERGRYLLMFEELRKAKKERKKYIAKYIAVAKEEKERKLKEYKEKRTKYAKEMYSIYLEKGYKYMIDNKIYPYSNTSLYKLFADHLDIYTPLTKMPR